MKDVKDACVGEYNGFIQVSCILSLVLASTDTRIGLVSYSFLERTGAPGT